ncbi:hypothetical protein AAG906_009086 [Vitis piasezkii]
MYAHCLLMYILNDFPNYHVLDLINVVTVTVGLQLQDFTTLEPTDAVGPSNRSMVAGNAAMMIWQSSATRAASNLTNTFLPNEIKR